jgi:hypothetical protein
MTPAEGTGTNDEAAQRCGCVYQRVRHADGVDRRCRSLLIDIPSLPECFIHLLLLFVLLPLLLLFVCLLLAPLVSSRLVWAQPPR